MRVVKYKGSNGNQTSLMKQLILEDIGKRFGHRVLFRRISCSVEGGQVLAVTGSNGSGKSTLLKIIAGVMTPTKGNVRLTLDGEVVADERRPLMMGYVAPYLNVYDGFSARENLAFVAKVRRQSADAIDELIEFVSLKGRGNDLVKTYSSGMKQRVKYAAALITEPEVLMLDEPSANLDEAGIAMVKQVIQRQRDRGGITIVATNNAEEVTWCDDVVDILAHVK